MRHRKKYLKKTVPMPFILSPRYYIVDYNAQFKVYFFPFKAKWLVYLSSLDYIRGYSVKIGMMRRIFHSWILMPCLIMTPERIWSERVYFYFVLLLVKLFIKAA